MDDAKEITELEKNIFGVDAYPDYLVEFLINYSDFFVVACVDNSIVGYICCEIKLGRGHVITIAVDDRYRRRGIGSKLMKMFILYALKHGVKEIYLEVSVRNKEAISFYRKFGFEVTGYLPRFYRDGSDAYVMTLKL